MLAFGPVPSRRLGRSLGINHIPPKVCTYSCIYCQVGRTRTLAVDRRPFHEPERIVAEVVERLRISRDAGEDPPDVLAFVPDGEPTLDSNLGRTIDELRPLGLRIAVITNGSLVARQDVRTDLAKADWVSLKVDAVGERAWRRLARPHRSLSLDGILEGMRRFRDGFSGELATETMLVAGENDAEAEVADVARFVAGLRPARAYLSIPTRPPARMGVAAPDERVLVAAHAAFSEIFPEVELLAGSEGDGFSSAGDARESLLSVTAVHPMRRAAVEALLARSGADIRLLDELLEEGSLVAAEHRGETFYVRRSPATGGSRRR